MFLALIFSKTWRWCRDFFIFTKMFQDDRYLKIFSKFLLSSKLTRLNKGNGQERKTHNSLTWSNKMTYHRCNASSKPEVLRVFWPQRCFKAEQDFSAWPFRSGRVGLAVSVWAVSVWALSVTGHFGLAVSVWGHFGQDISEHKQLYLNFVYLNDDNQAKCHSSRCHTNSLWGVMIAIKSEL